MTLKQPCFSFATAIFRFYLPKDLLCCARGVPTVCVSRWWAGVDSLWEQKKPEARKMLENGAESHQSAARFVGRI
jgi:hypothetical protein